MIAQTLLALLPSLVIGVALIQLVWSGREAPIAAWLLKGSLAVALGSGISSCLFFLWLVLAGEASGGFVIAEIILALALLGVSLARTRRAMTLTYLPNDTSSESCHPAMIMTVLLIGAAALVSFLASSWLSPHGSYDAWAIWNIHARFLFRGGSQWRDLGLPGSSAHPDYPLLVPALVARSWVYSGGETQLAPALLAGLFTFASAGILAASLALLRGPIQACLAAALMLGTSHFIYNSAGQMADVPLSAFFLAPLVLLALQARFTDHRASLSCLAGVLAALAVWTKNEGLLFFVVLSGACIFAAMLLKQELSVREQILPFVAAALPVLVVVMYFKWSLAPTNDLVAGQTGVTLVERLTNPARYGQVARAFITWLVIFGRGSIVVLAVYSLCVGFSWDADIRYGSLLTGLTVILMLVGYYFVFVTTPHDLRWHLLAFERLLVQLWPSALFTVLLLTATPTWPLARRKLSTYVWPPRVAQ